MSGTVCCFSGCKKSYVTDKDVSFFSFPDDPKRRKKWMQNCGNPQLESLPERQLRRLRICSDHFTPKSFISRTALLDSAVPNVAKQEKVVEASGEGESETPRKRGRGRPSSISAEVKEGPKSVEKRTSLPDSTPSKGVVRRGRPSKDPKETNKRADSPAKKSAPPLKKDEVVKEPEKEVTKSVSTGLKESSKSVETSSSSPTSTQSKGVVRKGRPSQDPKKDTNKRADSPAKKSAPPLKKDEVVKEPEKEVTKSVSTGLKESSKSVETSSSSPTSTQSKGVVRKGRPSQDPKKDTNKRADSPAKKSASPLKKDEVVNEPEKEATKSVSTELKGSPRGVETRTSSPINTQSRGVASKRKPVQDAKETNKPAVSPVKKSASPLKKDEVVKEPESEVTKCISTELKESSRSVEISSSSPISTQSKGVVRKRKPIQDAKETNKPAVSPVKKSSASPLKKDGVVNQSESDVTKSIPTESKESPKSVETRTSSSINKQSKGAVKKRKRKQDDNVIDKLGVSPAKKSVSPSKKGEVVKKPENEVTKSISTELKESLKSVETSSSSPISTQSKAVVKKRKRKQDAKVIEKPGVSLKKGEVVKKPESDVTKSISTGLKDGPKSVETGTGLPNSTQSKGLVKKKKRKQDGKAIDKPGVSPTKKSASPLKKDGIVKESESEVTKSISTQLKEGSKSVETSTSSSVNAQSKAAVKKRKRKQDTKAIDKPGVSPAKKSGSKKVEISKGPTLDVISSQVKTGIITPAMAIAANAVTTPPPAKVRKLSLPVGDESVDRMSEDSYDDDSYFDREFEETYTEDIDMVSDREFERFYASLKKFLQLGGRWTMGGVQWDPQGKRKVIIVSEPEIPPNGRPIVKRCLQFFEDKLIRVFIDGMDMTDVFGMTCYAEKEDVAALICRVAEASSCCGIPEMVADDVAYFPNTKKRNTSYFDPECPGIIPNDSFDAICLSCRKLRELVLECREKEKERLAERRILSQSKNFQHPFGQAFYSMLNDLVDETDPSKPKKKRTKETFFRKFLTDTRYKLNGDAGRTERIYVEKPISVESVSASFQDIVSKLGFCMPNSQKNKPGGSFPRPIPTTAITRPSRVTPGSSSGMVKVERRQPIMEHILPFTPGSSFTLDDGQEYELIGEVDPSAGDFLEVKPTPAQYEIIEVDDETLAKIASAKNSSVVMLPEAASTPPNLQVTRIDANDPNLSQILKAINTSHNNLRVTQ